MDKKIIGVAAILLFLWMNKKPQAPRQFGFQVLQTPEELEEELPDRNTPDAGGGVL